MILFILCRAKMQVSEHWSCWTSKEVSFYTPASPAGKHQTLSQCCFTGPPVKQHWHNVWLWVACLCRPNMSVVFVVAAPTFLLVTQHSLDSGQLHLLLAFFLPCSAPLHTPSWCCIFKAGSAWIFLPLQLLYYDFWYTTTCYFVTCLTFQLPSIPNWFRSQKWKWSFLTCINPRCHELRGAANPNQFH